MRGKMVRCITCIHLLVAVALFAQDTTDDPFADGFGTGDGFGDGGFSIEDDAAGDTSETAPSATPEEDATYGDSFGDFSSFGTADAAAPLSLGGRLDFTGRAVADHDEPEKTPIDLTAGVRLDLSYTAAQSEFFTRLEFTQGTDATLDLTELAENSIDESYASFFYDRFTFRVGYMKTVWGTGDQIHVVDLLNSNDYTDFINPDYLDRRSATGMFKFDVPVGRAQLEFAYVPVLNPDTVPETGIWAPSEIDILNGLVDGYVDGLRYFNTSGLTSQDIARYSDPERLLVFEDAQQLEDAQIGARLTTTAGRFDLGAIYYWGYLKTPVPIIRLADEFNANAYVSALAGGLGPDPPAPAMDGTIRFVYPRMHAFGLESAAVFGPFNTRAEFAYYLTEDIEGDDPEMPNNSLNYLLGFDVDLPISSLNLNVQAIGTTILASNKIDDAGPIANPTPEIAAGFAASSKLSDLSYLVIADPSARYNYEYNEDGIYTEHIISAALTDGFRNDRIRPELAASFGVEYQDWRIRPALEWDLLDDAVAEISYTIYAGDEDGRFGYFDENDFIELTFTYSF